MRRYGVVGAGHRTQNRPPEEPLPDGGTNSIYAPGKEFMARFRHLILVCTNERPAEDARGSCTGRGSAQILDRLKSLTHEHQLKGKVRVVNTGCLDFCAKGCTVAIFSEDAPQPETWYTYVTPQDTDELFATHVLSGKLLTRLVEPIKARPGHD